MFAAARSRLVDHAVPAMCRSLAAARKGGQIIRECHRTSPLRSCCGASRFARRRNAAPARKAGRDQGLSETPPGCSRIDGEPKTVSSDSYSTTIDRTTIARINTCSSAKPASR
jgi:hypothetical protein